MNSPARITVSEWQASGRDFDYRGHPIFTRVDGPEHAEPLLLIHGFPTASWDWEALWPQLAERYRVYTLDMVGFGLSAKPMDYAYAIADQADLFEAFLRHHKVQSYHVLAHDYGDTVAQELLARQGEAGARPRLLSLAMLNGGLFPETHRPVLTQKLLLSPLGPLLARLMGKASFAANMRRIFGPSTQPDADLIDAFWTLLRHNQGTRVMPKLIRYMVERRIHRARWVGALQTTQLPLKLINGSADPISGAHMVDRYRTLVRRPNISALDGIGHYPQCEAPDRVLAAYSEFRTAFTL